MAKILSFSEDGRRRLDLVRRLRADADLTTRDVAVRTGISPALAARVLPT